MVDLPDDHFSIKVGHGKSRRQVMRELGAAAGAVGVMASWAGCLGDDDDDGDDNGDSGDNDNNGDDSGNGNGDEAPAYQQVPLIPPPTTPLDMSSEPPEREVIMSTHDAATSFFDPTIGALHDAANQLGWEATFTGPAEGFSTEDQVNGLESAVDSGPDAIITTVADPSSYDDVVNRALDDGIDVVFYNTISHTREEMTEVFGRPIAYTGQDQIAAGYVCGLEMAQRLDSEDGSVTPGLSDPGHAALDQRVEGMIMALEQNSDVDINDALNYTGEAQDGVGRIEDHIEANPDLLGIMGADAYTWFIGDAIDSMGRTGEILGGGFDLTEETMDHIDNGVIEYTIGQDPYSQGYMPVHQVFAYLDRGMPAKDYRTGAEVIDQEGIEFAFDRAGQWGDLREYHGA